MTQTTLFSDKQLFVSLYKSALRRMKGLSFIYTVLCFISYPMPYIMEAVEAARSYELGYRHFGFIGIPEIYTDISLVFYFAVVIAGAIIISAYCNSFMHNRRAVDVFHALPAKRSVMLLANFAAVATILVTAQLICYSVVAVASVTMVKNILLKDIFAEFLRVLLLTLMITAVTFFCCVCCNTALDSAIFAVAFMFVVPAYTLLMHANMSIFLTGYDTARSSFFQAVKFSPVIMMYQTFMDGEIVQGFWLNTAYVIFTVALVALSCVLYTKRKSETAQSADTKKLIYQFIILATSTGGGVLFGILYHEVFGVYNAGEVTIGITSCIFTAAIYLVFNAFMARNPRPTKRGLMGLAASLAVVVAFIACVDNGFFGFESYIPQTEKIQSVSINYTGDYRAVEYLETNRYGDFYHNVTNNVVFTEAEEIEQVRKIHQSVVNNLEKETNLFYHTLHITYTLDSGRTVKRTYRHSIPVETIQNLVALEDYESFKTQLYPVLYCDVSQVKNFEIKDGFGYNYKLVNNLTDSQKTKLYNAMAQDTLNITRQMKDQHRGPVLARIGVNYIDVTSEDFNGMLKKSETNMIESVTVEIAANGYYHGDKYPNELYRNVIFNVTPDCINTIKALEEIGLGQYTTLTMPENMQAVVLACYSPLDYDSNKPYWKTDKYFDQTYDFDMFRYEDKNRVVEYSDPQQLAQLAESCQVSLYGPSQSKTFYAVAFMEKGTDWEILDRESLDCMIYYISGNNVPDFVKNDLAAHYNEDNYYGYYGVMGN